MHSIVLQYLDEVGRQGSFRKAGSVLNVTPSALNRQILKLEAELGVRLFDRRPDGVDLTTAGTLLLDHARQTLFNYERIRDRLNDIRLLRAGQITMSCINSLMFYVVPRVVSETRKLYPDITFTVRDDSAEIILQALEDENVNIGFTFSHFHHPGVRNIFDIPAQFGAVVSVNHQLAGRSSVTLEECLEYPMVRTYSPTGRHTFIEEEAKELGLKVLSTFYTNSMVMAKKAISMGAGIGIYMKLGIIEDLRAGELAYVPLVRSRLSDYRLGLFCSSRVALNDIDRRVLDVSKAVLKDI